MDLFQQTSLPPERSSLAYNRLRVRMIADIREALQFMQDQPCYEQNHFAFLDQADADLFLHPLTFRYCQTHASYHSYNPKELSQLVGRMMAPYFKPIASARIEPENRKLLEAYLRKSIEVFQSRVQTDRQDVEEFLALAQDAPLGSEILSLRQDIEEARDEANRLQILEQRKLRFARLREKRKQQRQQEHRYIDTLVPSIIPPKVPINKLSDENLLEFYECFRKRKYLSENMAIVAIEIFHEAEKTSMSAYECSHCREYHIGHTSKSKSITQQKRDNAATYWNAYPDKADRFALFKGLLQRI